MIIIKHSSQEYCLNSLQFVEHVVIRERRRSTAPSALVFFTVASIVKGKTGKKMDTRRSVKK